MVLAGATLAGCGGSKHQAATTVAGNPLVTAANATEAQQSEDVGLDGQVALSGQQITVKGSGAFGDHGSDGKMNLRVGLGALGSTDLEAVFQGNTAFVSAPLLSPSLPHGKHWLRIELGKPARVFGLDLGALTGQTPTAALAQLRHASDVTAVGSDSVGGVDTTHYRGQNAGRTLDVWVDGKNLVRKLTIDYAAHLEPTSKQGAHTVMTMTLSNFGTSVSATPPPAADVADVSEVKG